MIVEILFLNLRKCMGIYRRQTNNQKKKQNQA